MTPDAVMLKGEHHQESTTQENGLHRSEFRYGQFARTVQLPKPVQHEQVQSTFKDGILTLTMPKAKETQQKVVKIDLIKQRMMSIIIHRSRCIESWLLRSKELPAFSIWPRIDRKQTTILQDYYHAI